MGGQPDRGGAHQPLPPAAQYLSTQALPGREVGVSLSAKQFAQTWPREHVRQVGARNCWHRDMTSGGHHHRVGRGANHIVGRNILTQLHFHGAGPDFVAQIAQERLVFRVQNARPAQGAAHWPLRSNSVTWCPRSAATRAASSPAGTPPITMTRLARTARGAAIRVPCRCGD